MAVEKFLAWVAYMDVYGFKALLRERGCSEIAETLQEQLLHSIEIGAFNDATDTFHVLSDSIFLVFKAENEQKKGSVLKESIFKIDCILSSFLNRDLPLRGGMAFGEVYLDQNIIVGMPVVRAVEYEGMIAAPLVLLPDVEMSGVEPTNKPTQLRCTHIPLKYNKMMSGYLIMPMTSKGLITFIEEQSARYRRDGPYDVANIWTEAEKFLRNRGK